LFKRAPAGDTGFEHQGVNDTQKPADRQDYRTDRREKRLDVEHRGQHAREGHDQERKQKNEEPLHYPLTPGGAGSEERRRLGRHDPVIHHHLRDAGQKETAPRAEARLIGDLLLTAFGAMHNYSSRRKSLVVVSVTLPGIAVSSPVSGARHDPCGAVYACAGVRAPLARCSA
jgi:hypothetical protein